MVSLVCLVNNRFLQLGVSLGLERLITIMEERGMLSDAQGSADVWVTVFDEEHQVHSLQIAQELRRSGYRTFGIDEAWEAWKTV